MCVWEGQDDFDIVQAWFAENKDSRKMCQIFDMVLNAGSELEHVVYPLNMQAAHTTMFLSFCEGTTA